ncbi:MAG: hypothetical protein ACYDAG_02515 [Chloroflexota bacterium]
MPIEVTPVRNMRGRRIDYYRASLGEVAVRGATPSQAKQALMDELEQAVSGAYGIRVVYPIPGETGILLWRELTGWHYTFTDSIPSGPVFFSAVASPHVDFLEAERRARLHLARNLSDPAANFSAVGCIEDASDQDDHMSWFAWQLRYLDARRGGYSDDQAHLVAGGMVVSDAPCGNPATVPPIPDHFLVIHSLRDIDADCSCRRWHMAGLTTDAESRPGRLARVEGHFQAHRGLIIGPGSAQRLFLGRSAQLTK